MLGSFELYSKYLDAKSAETQLSGSTSFFAQLVRHEATHCQSLNPTLLNQSRRRLRLKPESCPPPPKKKKRLEGGGGGRGSVSTQLENDLHKWRFRNQNIVPIFFQGLVFFWLFSRVFFYTKTRLAFPKSYDTFLSSDF